MLPPIATDFVVARDCDVLFVVTATPQCVLVSAKAVRGIFELHAN